MSSAPIVAPQFIPWLRTGLASSITVEAVDGLAPGETATVTASVRLRSSGPTADEVDGLRPQLHACLVTLEHAAESVGLNLPATQPFAGLCSIDPQHGAATSSPDGDGLCRACIAAIGTDVELPVRMVAKDGRAVPFDEIDLSSPSHDHSPFDGEGDR